MEDKNAQFINSFNLLSEEVNRNAHNKGFYNKPSENGTRMMLMVSEIAEAMEADRHGNPPDDKIPEYSGMEAELADAIIRIMDFCHQNKLRVAEALIAKAEFNSTRPHMHGGKKY